MIVKGKFCFVFGDATPFAKGLLSSPFGRSGTPALWLFLTLTYASLMFFGNRSKILLFRPDLGGIFM